MVSAFVCFVLRICLLLVSIFDSFVASTEISSKMSEVTMKQERDDPNYYQFNTPGNDTNFHMCLSHERIGCLSVDLSMPLFFTNFWSLNMKLLSSVRIQHFHAAYHVKVIMKNTKRPEEQLHPKPIYVCLVWRSSRTLLNCLICFSEGIMCRPYNSISLLSRK